MRTRTRTRKRSRKRSRKNQIKNLSGGMEPVPPVPPPPQQASSRLSRSGHTPRAARPGLRLQRLQPVAPAPEPEPVDSVGGVGAAVREVAADAAVQDAGDEAVSLPSPADDGPDSPYWIDLPRGRRVGQGEVLSAEEVRKVSLLSPSGHTPRPPGAPAPEPEPARPHPPAPGWDQAEQEVAEALKGAPALAVDHGRDMVAILHGDDEAFQRLQSAGLGAMAALLRQWRLTEAQKRIIAELNGEAEPERPRAGDARPVTPEELLHLIRAWKTNYGDSSGRHDLNVRFMELKEPWVEGVRTAMQGLEDKIESIQQHIRALQQELEKKKSSQSWWGNGGWSDEEILNAFAADDRCEIGILSSINNYLDEDSPWVMYVNDKEDRFYKGEKGEMRLAPAYPRERVSTIIVGDFDEQDQVDFDAKSNPD